MPRVDLHLHSTFSDGALDPELLAGYIASRGAAYAALTDHDTTEGSARFREALSRRGIGCIDGVELTTRSSLGEIHLLAYSAGPHHPLISDSLPRAKDGRGLAGLAGLSGEAGRRGGNGRAVPTTVEALRAVRSAGAAAFLAHPLHVSRDEAALEALLDELVPAGLDGIEAIYGEYDSGEREGLLALAARRGLAVCAGSDFHEPGGTGPAGVEEMGEELWRSFRDSLLRRAKSALPAHADMALRRESGSAPRKSGRPSLIRIALPAFAAALLFVASLFAFIIPQVRGMLHEHKKEAIREIAESAASILAEYDKEVRSGSTSLERAQRDAAARIRDMRYGPEGKDYLWITDSLPRMIMHPYRPELDGRDLRDFRDEAGLLVFVEFVRAAAAAEGGYVEYLWQWKDDANRVVPKLSYVLRFAPWDWIIGTGVYLDDVAAEIAALTSRLVLVSAGVSTLLALILVWMVRQGLKAEGARLSAENAVRESRERYRALVEASKEGMVIVIDGACTFANASILEMTGFSEHELLLLSVGDLFAPYPDGGEEARRFLASLAPGERPEEPTAHPFACMLSRKSGNSMEVVLGATRFSLGGKEGMILAARGAEIETQDRAVEASPVGEAGIFAARWSRRAGLVEADAAALGLFGASGTEELRRLGLFSLFPERGEELYGLLASRRVATRFRARLAPPGKAAHEVLLTAFLDEGKPAEGPRVLGIVEDIGDELRAERSSAEREALKGTERLGIMGPAASIAAPPLSCGPDEPAAAAAERMRRAGAGEILVLDAEGRALGALSESDLSRRVLAAGLDPGAPVYRAMTAPLPALDEGASIAQAREAMLRGGTAYVALARRDGTVAGIVHMARLADIGSEYPAIAGSAERARSAAELADLRAGLVEWARAAIAAGARARTTARLFTDCHDRIARRLVELAVADLGAPPCGYAFVALGSAGRRELMPDSDQDDAIVFRPDGGDGEGERGYFLALGDRVCRSLGEVGLPPCTHGIVAMNREWCAPLALWESYFSRWIREPEPENLLEINAFFDMRTIVGDEGITRSLRESVFRMLREEPAFLIHLAKAARNLRIPALPIHDAAAAKEAAALFPAFARAYALKAGIRETGTFDRLDRLAELAAIGADTARESIESFEFLLRGRLEGALSRMPALGFPPAPLPAREKAQRESGRLVDIQRRAALAQASALQKRIGFDFLGAAP